MVSGIISLIENPLFSNTTTTTTDRQEPIDAIHLGPRNDHILSG
jgi:hypothetical protein